MGDEAWEVFLKITSAYWGKQAYFEQDNGTIYSRISWDYLPRDEALDEFLSKICVEEV